MGCRTCGSGNRTVEQYQVRWDDGTVTRYTTEAEARSAAETEDGASFETVRV
jgi:hypothetical protein